MKKADIIGAGTMDQSIANTPAFNGYDVTVCDIKIEWAQGGTDKIARKLDKLVSREKMTTDKATEVKGSLRAGEYKDLANCDLIVEAVLEKMEVKKELFTTLDEICKDSRIFGSNTSSLSVTKIAIGIKHNVIDMHFFNLTSHIKLIKAISGISTLVGTKEAIFGVSKSLGKTPVEIAKGPEFVVNRILVPMINEVAFILQKGIAFVEDIDIVTKLGASHPMGPLALGDLIGLDTVEVIMDIFYNETRGSKYRCCTLIRKTAYGSKFGQKPSIGSYDYFK